MRIAVIGIGGIGGYIGTKLCLAYSAGKEHDIVFVQRAEHYKKIKAAGLQYIGKTKCIVQPNEIFEKTENAGLFDLVLIAVKSRDLEQTAQSLQGNLHKDSVVISLLNGVNNDKRIQKKLPKTTILNGCIYVSAAIERPGTVRQTGGAGNLIFGPEDGNTQPFEYIEKILQDAELKAVLSSNITKAVWEKYILISSWASLSTKYNFSIGALLSNAAIREELYSLLNEVASIAKALHVGLEKDIVEKCLERYAQLPYFNKTSMQLDFEAGKTPEIDCMTIFIIETAEKLGIDVPAHRNVLEALSNL